jgi:coenzyme F420-reducing hydrogenase alpha subunit
VASISPSRSEQHFEGEPQSTALHSVPPDERYLRPPRINLGLDRLPLRARQAADDCGIDWPSRNNFHSIVARAIEVVAAFEEAVRIVGDYRTEASPSRIQYTPHAGEGCHATEAPRGLIFHRYRIGDDGLIAEEDRT